VLIRDRPPFRDLQGCTVKANPEFPRLFYKGYATHGTTELSRLGGPASHGCVRLHPRNAATLYALVQGFGGANAHLDLSLTLAGRS
jgi:L,D-transpeptidase catalytic domain